MVPACCSVWKSAILIVSTATSNVAPKRHLKWTGNIASNRDSGWWCKCVMSLHWPTDMFFFSLSVCLLQQWETFSERSSSSQTLTQFDSNIAPADPVSQSLSMHGFTINGQTLTLSGSLCAFSLSVSFCMMIFQRAVCCISNALYVLWCGWFRFNTTAPLSLQLHPPITNAFAYWWKYICCYSVTAVSTYKYIVWCPLPLYCGFLLCFRNNLLFLVNEWNITDCCLNKRQ